MWPSWATRPIGVVARVLVAILGVAAGAAAATLATFSATFKKYPAEWTFENISLFALGVTAAVLSLWVAIRPSRVSWLCLAMVVPVWMLISGLV